jgi:hypothetical protein
MGRTGRKEMVRFGALGRGKLPLMTAVKPNFCRPKNEGVRQAGRLPSTEL